MPNISLNENIGGFYKECAEKDLITPIQHLVANGSLTIRDGVITTSVPSEAVDTPWHHTVSADLNCALWHQIMFDIYGLLPSACLQCWKVVFSPQTVEQLFETIKVQEQIGKPSKCGIEIRPQTDRLYGAYWYNRSLDEGQERYMEVWKALQGNDILRPSVEKLDDDGYPVNLILKRACTEFELSFGPSNLWDGIVTDEQLDKEEKLSRMFDTAAHSTMEQDPRIQQKVKMRWIKWAYENGDKTYLKFTDNQPLYKKCLTYHKLDLSSLPTKQMDIVGHKEEI